MLTTAITTLGSLFVGCALGQTITPIPNHPTLGTPFTPVAMSGNGSVVVGYYNETPNNNGYRAYRWTPAGGVQSLGQWPGSTDTHVTGISRDGQYIIGYNTMPGGSPLAVYWNPALQQISLGHAPGGTSSLPTAINADATVIVGYGATPAGTKSLIWNQSGLNFFSDGLDMPNGINGAGDIIVGARGTGPFSSQPFRWTAPGPTQMYVPAWNGGAGSVSDSGKAMTLYLGGLFPSGSGVRWRSVHGTPVLQSLGTIPVSGYTSTTPYSMTADGGGIVGIASHFFNGQRSFIWSQFYGCEELFPLLPSKGVNMTGWTALMQTQAISADGTAIAGVGYYNNQVMGYVARNISCLVYPRIEIQPLNTRVCPYSTATFSIEAIGSGTKTYQWFRETSPFSWNFVPISDGVTFWGSQYYGTNTPTLQIDYVQPQDEARYYCGLYAPCVSEGSLAVQLTLGGPPVINIHPSQAACVQGVATFDVGVLADPADGPLTYQWWRNCGGPFPTWDFLSDGVSNSGSIISGANGPTLTITNPNAGDDCTYFCTIGNSCGLVGSNYAGMTLQTHAIQFQPDSATFCPGDSPSFFTAAGPGINGPFTYQWYRYLNPIAPSGPSVALSDGPTGNGSTISGSQSMWLTHNNVATADEGWFYCVASTPCISISTNDVALTQGLICAFSCDSIDFNNDESLFDPLDIDSFLSVYAEGPCLPEGATCNDIDFNNDGSVFDPRDIESFLSVYAEGPCI